MPILTIIAVIISALGLAVTVLGTGIFINRLLLKQTNGALSETVTAYKESLTVKEHKIGELLEANHSLRDDLVLLKKRYLSIVRLNLRLQQDNLYWKSVVEKMARKLDIEIPAPPTGNDSGDSGDGMQDFLLTLQGDEFSKEMEESVESNTVTK